MRRLTRGGSRRNTAYVSSRSVAAVAPLMAYSPKHHTEMSRLVADAGKRASDELPAESRATLMERLSVMGRERSGLKHLMHYLQNLLFGEDRQELLDLIEDYRQGTKAAALVHDCAVAA